MLVAQLPVIVTPVASALSTMIVSGHTVSVTVVVLPYAAPSYARYVNKSSPMKLALGVYVKDPFALRPSAPYDTSVTRSAVIDWL